FQITFNCMARACPFWFLAHCCKFRLLCFNRFWLRFFSKWFLRDKSKHFKHFHVFVYIRVRGCKQLISCKNRIGTCKETHCLTFSRHLSSSGRKPNLS